MRFKYISITFFIVQTIIIPSYAISNKNVLSYTPWFTGPLLSPNPTNMQPKHPAIEPSLTVFDYYGKYNSHWHMTKKDNQWAINPMVDFQFGITDRLGVESIFSFISNFKDKLSSTHFQDTNVLFGYQLLNEDINSSTPDLRIILQETFPTGKYQKFSPKKSEIDSTGMGSFQTGPLLIFHKTFRLSKNFFSFLISLGYLFPSQVHVKGFNTYGGGFGTKGKVKPGSSITSYISGEYSFNQNWVFAFDTQLLYQQKSSFSGYKGITSNGKTSQVGLPSSFQLSFAPQLEYDFSPASGLILGAWATLIGKNSPAFIGGFLAYQYVF